MVHFNNFNVELGVQRFCNLAGERGQQVYTQAVIVGLYNDSFFRRVDNGLCLFGIQPGGANNVRGVGFNGQLGQQDVSQLGDLAQRQMALGQGLGSLAAQYGQFGSSLGQLGVQQAGIGEIGQNIRQAQIGTALQAGNVQHVIDQAALDATRLTNLQAQQYPYQQYGFLSDIYAGIPTSQSTVTASSAPQVSPFQTALGLGISGLGAAAGASKAGLF